MKRITAIAAALTISLGAATTADAAVSRPGTDSRPATTLLGVPPTPVTASVSHCFGYVGDCLTQCFSGKVGSQFHWIPDPYEPSTGVGICVRP